ncbi:methionyl-tRNA formyltransferase [Candidatus Dependentiae bacterium]|nr:methionyl-tRNA formyltransferase [Candidatus Dependentiae bacterium]
MRIVFAGSSDFGIKCLDYLIKEEELLCVITNPDKPAGRGMKNTMTPVKKIALENNIFLYQPENFNSQETLDLLNKLNPDIILVVSFGHIIKPFLLEAFPGKWINIHASLLPAYRGAAPINFAVFNGENETGISIIKIFEKLDSGDILTQIKTSISENDNFGSLYLKLQDLAVTGLKKFLDDLKNDNVHCFSQDESKVTFTTKITREFCKIQFDNSSGKVISYIRGLSPVPAAWTIFKNKVLKVYNAVLFDGGNMQDYKIGEIFVYEKKILAKCSDGLIEILDLQVEGKKRMDSKSFINGLALNNV